MRFSYKHRLSPFSTRVAWLSIVASLATLGGCDSGPPIELPRIDPADPELGRLVVFVDPGRSPLQAAFAEKHLPALAAAAQELGVTVTRYDVRNGAPAEVGITPLLVFINHRGRSVYQGRFTTPDRVKTFVRAARRSPQDETPLEIERTPVWQTGRTRIAGPIKIAPLTGSRPADHDDAAFVTQMRAALERGFEKFKTVDKVTLGRTDRRFYMDFNPWLASDGTLFLSVAMFSQFHCEIPVFSNEKVKVVGPWNDRRRLFADAARQLEAAVVEQMANAANGDGFDPVPTSVAVKPWNAIGLALPSRPAAAVAKLTIGELAQSWQVIEQRPTEDPPVLFRFASPLDSYAGEGRTLRGVVRLADGLGLRDAAGEFELDSRSITMGVRDLDEVLQSGLFLKTEKFPAVRFQFRAFEADRDRLGLEPAAGVLHGELTLRDKTVLLDARASLEPVAAPAGGVQLRLLAGFTLDIAPFGIPTPDGPAPAKFTMEFDVDTLLEPVAGSPTLPPASSPASQSAPARPVRRSPLGRPLAEMPKGPTRDRFEKQLAEDRAAFEAAPNDPDQLIWIGRRLGYLWRMDEAIETYSKGLERWPNYAPLLRHRGHRKISLRDFDGAIADLTRAAALIEGKEDIIEPDGLPNAKNIPLTTLGFNIWYHLGIAHFFKGEFEPAVAAIRTAKTFGRGFDDNLVATTDWEYMCLRRLGRHDEAAKLLEPIHAAMDIIENNSYHRRLLMYKGELKPDDLLGKAEDEVAIATQGFGVGHWLLLEGKTDEAKRVLEKVVSGPQWPSFAFIAAEAEVARMRAKSEEADDF